jgi:hypothetical protein
MERHLALTEAVPYASTLDPRWHRLGGSDEGVLGEAEGGQEELNLA